MPFFDELGISLLMILTDSGMEYWGNRESHEYQLYLAVENIDHSRTRARSLQSNGICERLHKTVLQEFYQVDFRKKVYNNLEELQSDLNTWMNNGIIFLPFWKIYMPTFLYSLPKAKKKMLDSNFQTVTVGACLSD